MNILYEGVDITKSIQIHKADIYDNAGGIADSMELVFSDVENLWGKWKPQKGDKIEVKESGFSSGIMFAHKLEQNRGKFTISTISIPLTAKTQNTKAWENVRFLEFTWDIANKYGFKLETFGIQNWLYERVDQVEQADFEFLAYRCALEGYMLKICNQKIVIYDEKHQEQQVAVKTIAINDFDGDYSFKTSSVGLYSSCIIQYNAASGLIKSEFKPASEPAGPILKLNIPVYNLAEADRFARGLLRYHNKYEHIGKFQKRLDPGLAAGINIDVHGGGFVEGKYFIEQITHKLVDEKTLVKLRKPLEGY